MSPGDSGAPGTSLPARLSALWGWVDANPFVTLCLPPAVFLAQFLLLVLLASYGFPDHPPESKVAVSLLLIGLFGLSFLCFGGIALGVRQAFLLPSKAFPVVGVLVNGAYLAGFSLFFLFVLVLRNLT